MAKKLLAVLFLIGGITFAAPKGCPTHYYIVEPVALMPYVIKYHKELKLTREQREEIKKLIREIKAKVIPLDRKINLLTERVREDMLKVDDPLIVEGEMRVLANLKVERSMYNYICIKSLKRILTKEQFEKLLNIAGY